MRGGGRGGGGVLPLQARYNKRGGGAGCCPLQARYEKRGGGGGGVCCPLKARYEKRVGGGGRGGAVRLFSPDTKSGEHGGLFNRRGGIHVV